MTNRTVEATLKISSKLGSMKALDDAARKMAMVDQKAKAYNRSQNAMARGMTALNAAAIRYAAPAVIAAGVVAAGQAYATAERRMSRIGVTADASREQMEVAWGRIRSIAQETTAPVDNVVSGLESLVASGKSLDEAMALLPAVSGAAQAADAEFGAMASTADAVQQNFGLAAGEMQKAFDILAAGGKAGKFELKDMAQELPSLAPAFAALGYTGESGLRRLTAALQTVRKETGTSGEAATSLMEVLSKMGSETVSGNFKKFGIDIRTEMKAAQAAGEDTLTALIRLSKEAVGGDMSRLPQLFTDKQLLVGMRALMNNTAEMDALFGQLSSSIGTVDADLRRLSEDSQGSIDKMKNSWTEFVQAVGKGIAPGVTAGLDSITGFLNKDSAFVAGLKKRGIDPVKAKSVILPEWLGGYSEQEKGLIAFDGGWRTPESQLAAKGTFGNSPELGGRTQIERAMPVPTPRPVNGLQLPELRMPTVAPYIAPPSAPSIDPRNDSHLSELVANVIGNNEIESPDVVEGGAKINDAGGTMQSAAQMMAAAAAQMTAAVSGIRSAVANAGAGGGRVNADVGREASDPGGRFGGPR